MNLFILDRDPAIAASMNCDKHVCKIILEAAQMLGEAHRCNGGQAECGAITHRNNHVTKWVRETLANYRWTVQHAMALCAEYTLRYSKIHKYQRIIEWFLANEPNIPDLPMTPFRQAVADDCYHQDPVEAYRIYYIRYKSRFARWKLGNIPNWFVL